MHVEQADASATHPWSVHGGLGSLLGTPFLARGAEQQEIACDAYDLLHANPNRSAFTVAAEFRLNPSSYDKLLSRAASAQVESVSVGSLPPLSSELAIRQLLGLSLVDALAAGRNLISKTTEGVRGHRCSLSSS